MAVTLRRRMIPDDPGANGSCSPPHQQLERSYSLWRWSRLGVQRFSLGSCMSGVNCRLEPELQPPLDQQSASPHLPFHTARTLAMSSRPSSTLLELSLRVTRLSPEGPRQAPAWSCCATARHTSERSRSVQANSSWSLC